MERENQKAKATAKYTCWKMIGLDNEKAASMNFPQMERLFLCLFSWKLEVFCFVGERFSQNHIR